MSATHHQPMVGQRFGKFGCRMPATPPHLPLGVWAVGRGSGGAVAPRLRRRGSALGWGALSRRQVPAALLSFVDMQELRRRLVGPQRVRAPTPAFDRHAVLDARKRQKECQ